MEKSPFSSSYTKTSVKLTVCAQSGRRLHGHTRVVIGRHCHKKVGPVIKLGRLGILTD